MRASKTEGHHPKDRDRSHVEDNLNKNMKTSPPSRKHYDSSRQVTLLTAMIQEFLSYHKCTFLQLFAQRRKQCMRVNGLLKFHETLYTFLEVCLNATVMSAFI